MSGNPSPSPPASPEIDDTQTVIGIAFGNTTGSIAYTTPDSKPEIIANEEGDRQIPEVLSWAKLHLVRNAKTTVAYFWDFLGKKYSEINPTNSHNAAHPMDTDGVLSFNLQQADDETVTSAVITVPADFLDTTKEALVATAKASKLEVLYIIHKLTPEEQGVDKNILVADPGGTRCDAAIVLSRGRMYTILVMAHNYGLGRLKLDEVLVDHFSQEFIKKHKVDPGNERSLAKLRLGAEGAMRTLSLGPSATISIESLPDRYDFHFTVNRLRYELSARKVFDQIVSLVENVVKKAELDLLDIGEAGPPTTLKIASCIAALSPDLVPVNAPAKLTTALTIQASLIDEFDKQGNEQSTHVAVCLAPRLSHPIGVIIGEDNSFQTILEAQSTAPTRRIARSDVLSDGDVIVRIYEDIREIVVEKVERQVSGENREDDGGEADGDDEVEEAEASNPVLNVHKVTPEAATKGITKSGKVEVTIDIG
ncbi:hypothetical protein C7212DRAFT_355976 [Tuber magnatum]|uniref:Actin-like ATPase domain-containing protein n=1 Tax=Tuber magnatum TaxID=42249 RepID=A0A317T2S5_9PEZI|nr:hypothetical protein C7212DRAFT_355976 [Tuber magnatum]